MIEEKVLFQSPANEETVLEKREREWNALAGYFKTARTIEIET